MSAPYSWSSDPEADADLYFHDEEMDTWDERIDRLRDNATLDDWYGVEQEDW